MRRTALACILLSFASQAQANDRIASLLDSFGVMCLVEPIDFPRLKAKAQAMRLPIRKDIEPPPDSQGNFARSISWLLPLTTGPHEFVISEGHGPRGDIKGCGIGAPDVQGAELKAEMISTLKLGSPISERDAPDGKHITMWMYGSHRSKLILADGSSRNESGFYLTLPSGSLERTTCPSS
jgi:hypothetical protein